MPKVLPRTLNLLDPVAAPKNTWDKIYDWVFSAGRVIIILVEIVVLAAFASRFYFDRKNNDLKDGIAAKTEMLDAQSEFEARAKKTQMVLISVNQNLNSQFPMSGALQNVLDGIPSSVSIDNFTITQRGVTMTCRAPSYAVVEQMENAYKQDPVYSDVSVTLSKSGVESDVSFTMNLTLAELN